MTDKQGKKWRYITKFQAIHRIWTIYTEHTGTAFELPQETVICRQKKESCWQSDGGQDLLGDEVAFLIQQVFVVAVHLVLPLQLLLQCGAGQSQVVIHVAHVLHELVTLQGIVLPVTVPEVMVWRSLCSRGYEIILPVTVPEVMEWHSLCSTGYEIILPVTIPEVMERHSLWLWQRLWNYL